MNVPQNSRNSLKHGSFVKQQTASSIFHALKMRADSPCFATDKSIQSPWELAVESEWEPGSF